MNHSTTNENSQAHLEHFDPTDEGLRRAWSTLLVRYPWDAFATLTFKHPRHDPFELVNAFTIFLDKWHLHQAVELGAATVTYVARADAYGRELPPRVKRRGPFVNAWKKGRYRPVWVLGIEQHKSGDLHMHACIKFETPWEMSRRLGWRVWADQDNPAGMKMGWARIEQPKSLGDVAGYVSKYVTKGGDVVLSPSFTAKRVQVPSSPHAAYAGL
jgi:hypothetical protein